MTRALEERSDGTTHLEMRVAKPKPKDKEFVDKAAANFAAKLTPALAKLRTMLEGQALGAATDEPPLKPSNGRFLSEPVTAGAMH